MNTTTRDDSGHVAKEKSLLDIKCDIHREKKG
jgi:hypothetical protein